MKLWDLSNSYCFWTRMHLKFGHKLIFTITLENMKLHYQLLCKKHIFLLSIRWRKISHLKKIQKMVIKIETNATKWKITILEKFRKKPSNLKFLWGTNTNYKLSFRIKKKKTNYAYVLQLNPSNKKIFYRVFFSLIFTSMVIA